jgi:hypothetical protein
VRSLPGGTSWWQVIYLKVRKKSERELGWFPNLQVKIWLKLLHEGSEESSWISFIHAERDALLTLLGLLIK